MNRVEIVIPLLAGFLLDVIIGDPHAFPHPIRLFGNMIDLGEKWFNKGKSEKAKEVRENGKGTSRQNGCYLSELDQTRMASVVDGSEKEKGEESFLSQLQLKVESSSSPVDSRSPVELSKEREKAKSQKLKVKGAFLTICLISLTYFSFWFLLKLISEYFYVYLVVSSVFIFYGLANRALITESLKVINVLKKEGIEAGRKQLSMIVGRDTSKLSEHEIRTAVLETLAENLSDGVIAPLFFYAIGGVPAMFAYKMANTLDSMIGYKSERYKEFGWFAAKFDDVLNFIPARITAWLMVIISFSWRGAKFIFKYGRKHASPNAGYPEAALAGILNCRFGGPNVYHGVLVEKPFIGSNRREVIRNDVYKASVINFFVAVLTIVIICSYYWFSF